MRDLLSESDWFTSLFCSCALHGSLNLDAAVVNENHAMPVDGKYSFSCSCIVFGESIWNQRKAVDSVGPPDYDHVR